MSAEIWTIRRVLTWTTQHFEKRNLDAPRLTAEVLLAHVLQVGRVRLYVDLDRPLDKSELATFRGLIERRLAGEPTQYLTGVKEFYNRPFAVDARVLVPRPETELLVERVLRELPRTGRKPTADAHADETGPGADVTASGEAPSPETETTAGATAEAAASPPPPTEPRVLDLCTGSGCIAITLAAERPTARVVATDLSTDALEVAKSNAEKHGVSDRLTLLHGDLFAPVDAELRFDVIVSNPPYIAGAEIDTLSAEVRREPRGALDGGGDGLELIRRIVSEAPSRLVAGGLLAMEIGETQGPAVLELLRGAGYLEAAIEKDLERRDRFAVGRAPTA